MRSVIPLIILAILVTAPAAAYDWEYLGMSGVTTTCIEADPFHGRILVGTDEGFWIHDVDTELWTERDDEGWIGRTVHAIQWDPDDPLRIVTGRENAFFKGYLELTTDGGLTNQLVHMSQGGAFVGLDWGYIGFVACGISDITPGELLYSEDGATWTPLTGHGHTAMTAVSITHGQEITVAGDDQVWHTYDSGATWQDVGFNLGDGLMHCLASFSIGGDILNEILLVGDGAGLWSNDFAFTEWFPMLGGESVRNATVAWTEHFWPISNTNIFVVVTNDGRVLVSDGDWFPNWQDETGNLPAPAVDATFLYETGDIYVCTTDGGVYHYDPLIMTGADVPVASGPSLAAWPNPFNPRASLRWSLPRAAAGRLAVYDLAGRLVTVLEQGAFAAGEHTRTWDASGRASGVYVARLETDLGSVAVRMVLVR